MTTRSPASDEKLQTHDNGYHGFNWVPTDPTLLSGTHRVYATYAGTSTPLWSGPRTVSCP